MRKKYTRTHVCGMFAFADSPKLNGMSAWEWPKVSEKRLIGVRTHFWHLLNKLCEFTTMTRICNEIGRRSTVVKKTEFLKRLLQQCRHVVIVDDFGFLRNRRIRGSQTHRKWLHFWILLLSAGEQSRTSGIRRQSRSFLVKNSNLNADHAWKTVVEKGESSKQRITSQPDNRTFWPNHVNWSERRWRSRAELLRAPTLIEDGPRNEFVGEARENARRMQIVSRGFGCFDYACWSAAIGSRFCEFN
jgi:hypothetical protein